MKDKIKRKADEVLKIESKIRNGGPSEELETEIDKILSTMTMEEIFEMDAYIMEIKLKNKEI